MTEVPQQQIGAVTVYFGDRNGKYPDGNQVVVAGADLRERAMAQKLVTEHEMGELFKVLALGRGVTLDPLGFAAGDRMHTL